MATDPLKDALRRLRRPRPSSEVDLAPASTFDALLDQRLDHLERHVEELKKRINGLLLLVTAAVVAQVVLGIWGYEAGV